MQALGATISGMHAIGADCVKPDGQNSVISFVNSKCLLPELSFSDRWLSNLRSYPPSLYLDAGKEVGSISAALSCLVYPPREEPREFGGGARTPFPNSGW